MASLLRILVPREIRIRYQENALNMAWALITPVAIMAVYGLVLTQTFDVDGTCSPYLTSAWAGLVLWTFVAASLGTAVWSIISTADVLSKVYFPRESIPLAAVGASLVDLAVGVVTLLVLAQVQHVPLTWHVVLAIVPIVLIVVWSSALGILVAALAVFVRDVTEAVQLALRLGFFATPVMYEASFLPPALRWTADINPVAVAITAVRDTVLCGRQPDWGLLGVHLVAGAGLLVAAVAYVAAVEGRMTDVV